ncbi:MAG TPA: hypothetical protein VEG35_02605 [Burkholderiales bacterium]|nr:hypothetical protein [Burkholderiales bacterium]
MTYEKDVASVDAIIGAIYDVISGPAGPKDWERERFIMHPTARMMRGLAVGGSGGPPPTPELAVFSVEEFIAFAEPRLAAEDFYEYETGREIFEFGRLAHVASAFASSRGPNEPPFARGINSIQLWFDGGRWWVMGVLWDWEGGATRVPARLRSSPKAVKKLRQGAIKSSPPAP